MSKYPHIWFGNVYFIKPIGMDGPIKIGFSQNPKHRLEQLMVWSPFPLEIAAAMPGTWHDEQELHKRFASTRLHKEWFSASPELLEYIATVPTGMIRADLIEMVA
jgi:hypothetical protein